MEVDEDGLVIGGVEVAWIKTDGTLATEVVFNPGDWLECQFLELRRIYEETGLESDRKIGIESPYVFAELSYIKSKYIVRYSHPKFISWQGFFSFQKTEEFKSSFDAAQSVVLRAASVDLFVESKS